MSGPIVRAGPRRAAGPLRQFNLRLPPALVKEFKVAATAGGVTMQAALAEALGLWLARREQRRVKASA